MKQFRCGDVVPGCKSEFRGTETEILTRVAEHARLDHGMTAIPETLVIQVRNSMTEAVAA